MKFRKAKTYLANWMEAKEFINRIIQLGFDKKAIDSYVMKLTLSSNELLAIWQNSFVIQWYATQVYFNQNYNRQIV